MIEDTVNNINKVSSYVKRDIILPDIDIVDHTIMIKSNFVKKKTAYE